MVGYEPVWAALDWRDQGKNMLDTGNGESQIQPRTKTIKETNLGTSTLFRTCSRLCPQKPKASLLVLFDL